MECYIILAFSLFLQMYVVLKYQRYVSELERKIHKLNETQQEALSAACKRYDDIIESKESMICFLKVQLEELDTF